MQAPPADCLDKGLPSEDPAIIIKPKVEEDSCRDSCYPLDFWHGENPSNFTSELETTDIPYPTASPIQVASCSREPGFVFNDLHGVAVTSSSDCGQMSACHDRGFMSPLEVNEFHLIDYYDCY